MRRSDAPHHARRRQLPAALPGIFINELSTFVVPPDK